MRAQLKSAWIADIPLIFDCANTAARLCLTPKNIDVIRAGLIRAQSENAQLAESLLKQVFFSEKCHKIQQPRL
jgi:hypothetical protein